MISVLNKQTLHANLQVSGDKSVTIRAILLGAIASGVTVIKNALISEDTLTAIDCAKKMGATIKRKGNKITITGVEKINQGQIYNCKNSGTLARLIIGILSGAKVNAIVIGDKSLSKRPMARVCEPLKNRGANIEYNGKTLPVLIKPANLSEFIYQMPVDSAQVKSAILLSGLTSGKKTIVIEKNLTRDHTEKMIDFMGGKVSIDNKEITLESNVNGELNGGLKGRELNVPCDPSSAAFYLSLGLLLGEVTVKNVLITALRAGFYKKLQAEGAIIKYTNLRQTYLGEVADITACKSKINYFEVKPFEIASLIDELPVLCVLASFNKGCKICEAGELRNKESDRISEICSLINHAGGKVSVEKETIIVSGNLNAKNFTFETSDHRMAMSAFVLMTAGKGGILKKEKIANISFPNFYKNYNCLHLGLVGENLSRSLSGDMHKYILTQLGVENFTYEKRSLLASEFDDFIKKCPYKAFNATIPYKERVFLACKKQSERAIKCYSSNYILNKTAYTTDGEGLLLALKKDKINVKNKKVLVYGCGGAGRSVALSLLTEGAEVFVANRTLSKAQEFCARVNGVKLFNGENCDILINATSVISEILFDKKLLNNAKCIIDINYAKDTALENYCRENSKKFFNGKAMLFFQALLSDCLLINKTITNKKAFELYDKYLVKYEN